MRFQAVSEAHGRFVQHPVRPIVALALFALCIRLLMTMGTNGILWPDSAAYYRSAALMAKYGNFHWHEIYRTPLYPMFMAPFLWLFDQNHFTGALIIAAQRLLGILSVILTYLIARRSFGPSVAFYGSALFAAHTLQLYYETAVHTETLFTFMLLLAVRAAQSLFQEQKLSQAALVGFLCALATLARPIAQFLVLIILAVLLLKMGLNRRWLKASAVALFTCFMMLLPWMLTNKAYYRFFGVSQDLGLNLFHRIIDVEQIPPVQDTKHPRVLRVWNAVKDQRRITYFLVYHGLLREKVRKVNADRMMAKFSLEALSQDSWRYLPQYLKNSVITFHRFFFDVRKSVQFCGSEAGPYMCTKNTLGRSEKSFSNDDQGLHPASRMLVRKYFRHAELPMAAICAFALVGFALALRRLRSAEPTILLMAVITLYFAALTAIFNIPEDRFRLPADPFLFLAAIFTLVQIVRYCKRKATHGTPSVIEHRAP